MALTYRSALRTRERILTYGSPGVGKSNAIMTVARKCPDATFHVLDTEIDNYDRLLDTDYTDLTNVIPYPIAEWAEIMPLIKKLRGDVGREDWVVVDSMTPTWDMVQSWFIESVHGEEDDNYFLEVRVQKQRLIDNPKEKNPSSLGALEGWLDWPVINKAYAKLYRELFLMPCHVYLTAEATNIVLPDGNKGGDDKATRTEFGAFGVKPKGQKRLGFVPQTVLLFTKSRHGGYSMTTVKDRGRVDMEETELQVFGTDYLVKVGGWRPVKVE